MDSGTPLASLPPQVFTLQSQILPSTCASPLFLHPVQPPSSSRRTENKTVSSAVSGLLAEVLFPPVSSKVLKRIARICSLHQSPSTPIVLRVYHSHSFSPSRDLKLLSSQKFPLNSHWPNSSTGIHFCLFKHLTNILPFTFLFFSLK